MMTAFIISHFIVCFRRRSSKTTANAEKEQIPEQKVANVETLYARAMALLCQIKRLLVDSNRASYPPFMFPAMFKSKNAYDILEIKISKVKAIMF